MSLPPELDFDRDRDASPARMNRAMEYLYLRLGAATALQPEFASALKSLQGVGLERLNEALTPIFLDASEISARLDAIRTAWLTGQPLTALLTSLDAQVTARLGAVDALLAETLAAVTAQISAANTAVNDRLEANTAAIATLPSRAERAFLNGAF